MSNPCKIGEEKQTILACPRSRPPACSGDPGPYPLLIIALSPVDLSLCARHRTPHHTASLLPLPPAPRCALKKLPPPSRPRLGSRQGNGKLPVGHRVVGHELQLASNSLSRYLLPKVPSQCNPLDVGCLLSGHFY